jgi:hypothetical protein
MVTAVLPPPRAAGWRAIDSGVADVAIEAAFTVESREVHCVHFRGLEAHGGV